MKYIVLCVAAIVTAGCAEHHELSTCKGPYSALLPPTTEASLAAPVVPATKAPPIAPPLVTPAPTKPVSSPVSPAPQTVVRKDQ